MTFTFHLAGINNQNFLMRDDQTGTYWQQITGRAVAGPLAGSQLELVHSDELTFGLWRTENPTGSVLLPVAQFAKDYESKNWDVRMAKARTVLDFPGSTLKSRDLIFGVDAFGASRAYPVPRILSEKLIEDHLNGHQLLIVTGPDNQSIRVFAGRDRSDFYRKPDGILLDTATGSEWNFRGCAISGTLAGTCLAPIPALKDYWFDWRNYHPATTVFVR